jgi:quercetin dioxygenase-like cupin family protein
MTDTAPPAPSLAERTIIHVDDQPWMDYEDETGFIPPGAAVKLLIDPESGNTFMLTRFAPNYRAPSHWHPSDTIYIITQGEFSVEGEGTYRPGDVRWVRGGTAYGSEMAGPDGCEFYIVAMGEFDVKDPSQDAPPLGHWHESPTG